MIGARLPAIIFDCDGVLVDSEFLASRVESEVLRDLGLDLTIDEVHDLFLGKTVERVLDLIGERVGARPGAGFTYNWAFATAFAFMRELKPVAGIRAALEEFAGRGHRMAVASQSPIARVRMSLAVTGLERFFGDDICVTSMVARPKPAPDIYLFAAARLGAAPGDCVVIEDSPAGAAAAMSVGMRAIGYAPGDTLAAMQASGAEIMRSMDELPGLLAPR